MRTGNISRSTVQKAVKNKFKGIGKAGNQTILLTKELIAEQSK
jgi:hypothetical protein